MINELYELSRAMREYGVTETIYAQNYSEVSYKKCACVSMTQGRICGISPITSTQKAIVRNYTSTSNGGFPCVKLAPLYRVTEKDVIKVIAECKRKPENLNNDAYVSRLESACAESNWGRDVVRKYQKALNLAHKINSDMEADPCDAFRILVDELNYFDNPNDLHKELSRIGIESLRARENVSLALDLLFNCVAKKSSSSGEISILFNAEALYDLGIPVTSMRFTDELNHKLLSAENSCSNESTPISLLRDAFGTPYTKNTEATVMPNVKIGADFYVKIRTMNEKAPCLHRYGEEGSATFPASDDVRRNLQMALNYIGNKENREKTWTCIDMIKGKPRDVLFAYPLNVPHTPNGFAGSFRRVRNRNISFAENAKKFISQLKSTRDPNKDSYANGIRVFVLRRLDMQNNSGRTKVVYTRQTDPDELERASEAWTLGYTNLPRFPFGAPEVPYPLDIADTLNCLWKQNGEFVTNRFKPVSQYHGMELLMEPAMPVCSDLHLLAENAVTLSTYLGYLNVTKNWHHQRWNDAKNMLALLGLFLYRSDIRKDDYMDNLPYLYGQLLKAADELHALYCNVVRNSDYPKQFAGGSLFLSASEMPIRTLTVLSQRIMPYYTWAKSYRLQGIQIEGQKSWRAGWLYHLCEDIVVKIERNWTVQTRLNEEEKAQMFIGYLAAFPKSEKNEIKIEEDTVNEQ